MKAFHQTPAILALLVCIFATVNISAATLVVTKTADTNDGRCSIDCSLREAINLSLIHISEPTRPY